MILEGKNEIDGKDLYFTYPQRENPDWDYARNRFFLLKRKDSSWSSSLFSVKWKGFTLPNRDYPQQGLLCMVGEEYTKFLDSLMFKLKHDNETVELKNTQVKVSPWKVIYFYKGDEVTLKVEYYLAKYWKDKAGGWINFEIDSEENKLFKLLLSPLVDIRGLGNASPDKEKYELKEGEDKFNILKDELEIQIGPKGSLEKVKEDINWHYKLGDGERQMKDEKVLFKGKERQPTRSGVMSYEIESGNSLKLGIVCGKNIEEGDLESCLRKDGSEDITEAKELLKQFKFTEESENKFLKARLISLDKFATKENKLEVPEAGEWWFKGVWFRDLFESLYHQMDFYRKVKGNEWIKKLFTWAEIYVKDGVMANRPSKKNVEYRSLDASLLYLLSMAKFYEKTGDEEFKTRLKKRFERILTNLGDLEELITSKANYSWMDSKVDGYPTRIPDAWDVENGRHFLLPEVNALWIRALEKFNKICGKEVNIKKVWNKYKDTFWNEKNDYIYQIVYRKGGETLRDPTESSVGVISMAILLDHFFGYEVLNAWQTIKEKLLVERKPVFFEKGEIPFGILTRNTQRRIYLGDEEYHGATIWPRDLPYLFKILEKIGRRKIVKQISKNILDHQMSEGAIFYNQELFSLPEGGNPSRMALSQNPVPVKNPAQLWSHFLPNFENF